MIVVSDTSPLNYLILIDADHVLPLLYDRVVIPTVVWNELRSVHPGLSSGSRQFPLGVRFQRAAN